jgi:predicted 3-demethylubiquinone-9 3-methyltransferase (glyoxalase superfamily)
MMKVTSHLWFDNNAEEAVRFYTSLVPGSAIQSKTVIPSDTPSGPEGFVYQIEFTLGGQPFMALNAGPLDAFNHRFSIMVHCDDQAEVDRLWDALLEGGGVPEQCGWLRDRYGVSWQIIPTAFEKMMKDPDWAKGKRVAEAMLKMIKLDIAGLKAAYDGTA